MSFGTFLGAFGLGMVMSFQAFADARCEQRIKATGLLMVPGDEKVACEQLTTSVSQDCMVELLTKGKGKLRNQDFAELIGLCTVDPSREVRDCVLGKLDKPWNDPGYVGVKVAGDKCLTSRKRLPVKYLGKPLANKPKKMGRVQQVPGLKEAIAEYAKPEASPTQQRSKK